MAESDVSTAVKRGGKRFEPEALHVVGVDKSRSSFDDELAQRERNRSLIPTRELAAIATAWGDIEQGGPPRAEELADEASERHGVPIKDILDDARLAVQLASDMPVIQPVSVAPDGTVRLVVVDGRRRVMAARAANVIRLARGGRPISVPIDVHRGSKPILARSMAVANEQRRANGPLALAEDAASCFDASQDLSIVALDLGVSKSSARNLTALGMLLRNLPDEPLNLLRSGKVKPTQVYGIARNADMTPDQKAEAVVELAALEPKPPKPPLKPRVEALVRALRGISAMLPTEAKEALAALPEFVEEPTP